ncbi:hypothetical protein ACFP3U_02465 [Kitasatospora misakiensis]|uniref:Uncharacterized protein n=1 Tax=Kitasatospora misakiensis TaxID=67330 RepID=A0ABW0WUB7_9ACTN
MSAIHLFVGLTLSFLALLALATVALGVVISLRMPGRAGEDGRPD